MTKIKHEAPVKSFSLSDLTKRYISMEIMIFLKNHPEVHSSHIADRITSIIEKVIEYRLKLSLSPAIPKGGFAECEF